MQNAAHAYLQTQVGTTGRGEIVVMLFDGALRFLAQAREKMEARDMAAKGLLISRALDIINELDSSLNLEAGGDLAQNLHNLYFLCSTRLLQANLKLDFAKLDSVVDTLSGLRSAFAEILHTPEAQAACSKMGNPAPATQQASAPRPADMRQQTAPVNRSMAANIYGQQAKFRQPAPAVGLSAPILPPQMGAAPRPGVGHHAAASSPAPIAQAAPVAPEPQQSSNARSNQEPASQPPLQTSPAQSPTPQPASSQPAQQKNLQDEQKPTSLRLGGGFTSKKLASYGKILQNK